MRTLEDLKRILTHIRAETVPMEGHTDPLAIDDCWAEINDTINEIESNIMQGVPLEKIIYANGHGPADYSQSPDHDDLPF